MHDIEDKLWASIIDVHCAAEILQVSVKLKVHDESYVLGEGGNSEKSCMMSPHNQHYTLVKGKMNNTPFLTHKVRNLRGE